jgi:methylase of polypeptide subunit release factors
MDHQMNMVVSREFGEYFLRLPLRKSANIVHGNALRLNWERMMNPMEEELSETKKKFDFIFGNPPFVGKQYQSFEQKQDLEMWLFAVFCGSIKFGIPLAHETRRTIHPGTGVAGPLVC